ncbi:hypothetical protein ASG43_18410 [Aureimonas sp. Leaf454]|uniref:hypothetical protein n=1 Tax=Aureimonas sp. Leaf454 TaxID=1736381 RepID=UPI000701F81D|nr:hypothetical protein [Aureimonas sp. Leaf454]KQT53203.1 hypothetical protein ASG43_18410 [Aureimonas sp. Leaf454]
MSAAPDDSSGNRSLNLGFSLTGMLDVYRDRDVEGQLLGADVTWCEKEDDKPQITSLMFVWTEKPENRKSVLATRDGLSVTVRLTSLPVFERIASLPVGRIVQARASFDVPVLSSFHVDMPKPWNWRRWSLPSR